MSLTTEQIRFVQASFTHIAPFPATAGAIFYRRLFELDPALRTMFVNDMLAQSNKLMAMLALVVENLEHLDTLLPQIAELGRTHRGYGVTPEHYDTVAAALLWTLRLMLEEQFTAQHATAWAAAYAVLADAMQPG